MKRRLPMKITRKKLENIIKEELTNVLKEQQAVMTPGAVDGAADPAAIVRSALELARSIGDGIWPLGEFADIVQLSNFEEVTSDYSHFDGDFEDHPVLPHLRNIDNMRKRYGQPKIRKVSDEEIKQRISDNIQGKPQSAEPVRRAFDAIPANIVAQEVAKIASEQVTQTPTDSEP